jgi:hypothetical protein
MNTYGAGAAVEVLCTGLHGTVDPGRHTDPGRHADPGLRRSHVRGLG